jgi:hypothetical protein
VGRQAFSQQGKQAVESGSFADGDVVDLVACFIVLRGGGEQVGLHGIVEEVAAGFAVAVDEPGDAGDQPVFGHFWQLTAQVFVRGAHGGLQAPVGFGGGEANVIGADDSQFDLIEFEHGELRRLFDGSRPRPVTGNQPPFGFRCRPGIFAHDDGEIAGNAHLPQGRSIKSPATAKR